MGLHGATLTATTTEALERYSTLYLVGGLVRQATDTDSGPTHYTEKYYPAGVAAGIAAFERGHRYRCVLSGSCSADQDLLQDTAGQLSPGAAGPKVGRAAYAGSAGDLIEFIFEPDAGGGGGGLTAGQVNTLINTAVNRSFNFSAAANDTVPTDADWPEGDPNENDILQIIRTPTTRRRDEFFQRGATVDDWTQIHVVEIGSDMSSPERSEFTALTDIPVGTPIDMNAATPTYTTAIGLDYTSHDAGTNATFNDIYGRDLLAYANGQKVQQADITRNDGDPAGHIRFNVIIASGAEIVFESQVVS